MEKSFKILDSDTEISKETVISIRPLLLRLYDLHSILQVLMTGPMLKLFDQELEKWNRGKITDSSSLFYQNGISCEILQPGWSGWKKGKLRVKAYLEFELDEPEVDETTLDSGNSQGTEIEFPLDEVRKAISDLS